MDTTLLADTCAAQPDSIASLRVAVETSNWDIASVVITFIFALANLILAYSVFKLNQASDEKKAISERRITMLKTLILDAKMESFFKTMDEIKKIADELLTIKDSDTKKKEEINNRLRECFYEFKLSFVDLLMAINYNTLYKPIMDSTVKLQDELTNAIFDEGIRLSHRPKYEEKILTPMGDMQINIIKILYNYDGNE